MAGVRALRERASGGVKILADINVSPRIVERLCGYGFQAERVSDVLDPRATDREILQKARELGALLISRDQDFSALLAVSGAAGPSLINVRVSYVDPDRIAHAIAETIAA